MQNEAVMTLTRRHVRYLFGFLLLMVAVFVGSQLSAQKAQDDYDDKFRVATEDGGIAVATSADGRYVYLVGKKGLIVSDDHGKTGSWVQTLRLK